MPRAKALGPGRGLCCLTLEPKVGATFVSTPIGIIVFSGTKLPINEKSVVGGELSEYTANV